jgi:hypothetical protein
VCALQGLISTLQGYKGRLPLLVDLCLLEGDLVFLLGDLADRLVGRRSLEALSLELVGVETRLASELSDLLAERV